MHLVLMGQNLSFVRLILSCCSIDSAITLGQFLVMNARQHRRGAELKVSVKFRKALRSSLKL